MRKIILLILPAILFSCSSSDDNAPIVIPTPAPAADAIAYVRGNVNGQPIDYTYNYNSGNYAYGFGNSTDGVLDDTWFSYGGIISTGTFTPAFYIYWDNMFHGGYGAQSIAFYDSFATLPTNYLTQA